MDTYPHRGIWVEECGGDEAALDTHADCATAHAAAVGITHEPCSAAAAEQPAGAPPATQVPPLRACGVERTSASQAQARGGVGRVQPPSAETKTPAKRVCAG
jgi:hypothetical protein